MRRQALGLAMVGVLAATACSSSDSNQQRDAITVATPKVATTVRYTDRFTPASVTLTVGQAIVLVNGDSTDHRFRTTPTAFDSGAQPAGGQLTWAFTVVGEYSVTADSNGTAASSGSTLTVKVQPQA
ncbi:MAG: hypothetical protein JWL70_1682 [Acidimicrobiia bacterium]|nr:hypothetical protein [Acidimicrobiia bacterium]